MTNVAIRVENLSKRYRIGLQEEIHDSLAVAVADFVRRPMSNLRRLRRLARFSEDDDRVEDIIWALKDISFEVEQGQVVGIIGPNGAGKTTLLRILSRITEPTRGRAEVHGRVSSLLEVGTGFHPELTGRENVYLNGTILGMTKAEITRKFREIVEFSGVEKFIDTPIKRYSSGMRVRLAFSVAAYLDPEILLVDEVLAVGDVAFQRKCLGKMGDVVHQQGRTILFVSHNMGSIRQLCPTCLWIEGGRIRQFGDSSEVVNNYLSDQERESTEKTEITYEEDLEKDFQVRSVRIVDEDGDPSRNFDCDKPVFIDVVCQVRQPVPHLYGYLSVSRTDGIQMMEADSFDAPPNPLDSLPPGTYLLRIAIPPRTLGHGDYELYLSFSSKFSSNDFNVDIPGTVGSFHLDDFISKRGNRRQGFFSTLLRWEILREKPASFESVDVVREG